MRIGPFQCSLLWMLCCGPVLGAAVDSNCGVQPMRASIRYSTPKGIGYKTGYTTLEAFLAPNFLEGGWLPFLDLRGHVFDNGKLAANAGIGLRRLGSSRV